MDMEPALTTIIFDFDGTIADTMALTFSVYNALAPQFGCRTVSGPECELLRMRRPQDFFGDFGMTLWKMPRFARRMRLEIGKRISEVALFDGMRELLVRLAHEGYHLGIISSNAEANIREFLELHNLAALFDFVWSGENIFGKAHVIRKCLRIKKIPKNAAMYIGDETRDVEAVKKAGIIMMAVTWGYSAPEVLAQMNPDALVDTPEALHACISHRSESWRTQGEADAGLKKGR